MSLDDTSNGGAPSRRPRRRRWRRRRWWQRLLRFGALVAVIAALLYATLPWWAPKRWLARRVAAALGEQLRLPVAVGRVDLSWRTGVCLSDLRIGAPAGFAGGDMVSVGRLRCELAPLKMLLEGWGAGGPLAWAELEEVRLHAEVDQAGQVNLAPLRRLEQLGPMPSRLAVRDAAATVHLPRHDRLLRLDVSDLQVRSGRLVDLGRLTMSAALIQNGPDAPVTLVASTKQRSPVATCSFRFAGVDISQLNLPRLLGAPLKHLAGTGSGQLDVRVNSAGIVEQFLFSLRVKDLDAQPRMGPALRVIESAEVSVSAAYDWYTRTLQLEKLLLRLPGIDVRGKGVVHAAALDGGWEGVRSLELSGQVAPATVAALLTGSGQPLGENIGVDGSVDVRLTLRGDEDSLWLNVLLDATAAQLTVGQRTAKPAGRKLAAELRGSIEKRRWQFSVDQTELRIGSNRFRGAGAMQNIRRVAAGWLEAGSSATLAMALDDLASLDWRGSWEIVDVESLRDLIGWPQLGRVRLNGKIEGEWSVEHAGMVLLRAKASAGSDTSVAIGDWFVKPAGVPLLVEASGDVARGAARLSRVGLWAGIGEAGVSIDNGRLTFAVAGAPGGEGMNVHAEGRYTVRDAGALLACLPRARQWARRIGGSAGGSFSVLLGPTLRRAHIEANATRLNVRLGEVLFKPAGQPAEVVADILADMALPAATRNRLELRANLGPARVRGAVTFASAGAGPDIRCNATARVADAAWLLQWTPALGRALRDLDVRGAMTGTLSARLDGEGISGELRCDADDIGFRLPGAGGVKQRGTALRVRLAGKAGADGAVVDVLAMDIGKSSIAVAGTIAPAAGRPARRGAPWPPPAVAATDLKVSARVVLDQTARTLLLALVPAPKQLAASGSLRASGTVHGDANGLVLSGQFDASGLALAAGGVRKPAGSPAHGRFDVTIGPDLALARVRKASVEAGKLRVRASGTCPLLGRGQLAGHVAIEAPDLQEARTLVPMLADCKAAGGLTIEADYARRGGRHVIASGRIDAADVSATVRGKRCRLNGSIALGDVVVADGKASVAAAATESLEWAVGNSHGFLVANLTGLPGRPAGTASLLCTNVDVPELLTWANPAANLFDSSKLSPAEREALGQRADRLLTDLRRRLGTGELVATLKADRLRYFDANVRAFYEVRGLDFQARAADTKLRAGYRCGLNGGRMSYSFDLDLDEPRPSVAVKCDLDRLMTGENILLQLAQEFPGNTVYGTFSRRMETAYPLRDALMNMLDSRHRLVPVGKAKTVTTDGVIRGRGGPKFMTRIFPRLNLTTYRYRRMTAFAEFRPDGTVSNDMIFDGANYNIYIEGTTDAERIGRYDVGVLLLATPQTPEMVHRLRQVRVPILKFKARIENGRFYDEEVFYARPDEAAYKIFLENNIFYRLWREAGRKRRQIKPDTQPASVTSGAAGDGARAAGDGEGQ